MKRRSKALVRAKGTASAPQRSVAVKPPSRCRLFIAGATTRSLAARKVLERILQDPEFTGRVKLEVTDVLTNPDLARRANLTATPTVLLESHGRTMCVIGDLSRAEDLIEFLQGGQLCEASACPYGLFEAPQTTPEESTASPSHRRTPRRRSARSG